MKSIEKYSLQRLRTRASCTCFFFFLLMQYSIPLSPQRTCLFHLLTSCLAPDVRTDGPPATPHIHQLQASGSLIVLLFLGVTTVWYHLLHPLFTYAEDRSIDRITFYFSTAFDCRCPQPCSPRHTRLLLLHRQERTRGNNSSN